MSLDNVSAPAVVVDDLDFGPATGLVCRECGAHYSLGAAYACMECFGPRSHLPVRRRDSRTD